MKSLFFVIILLAFSVPAYADWSNAGMHPVSGPNLMPNPGQPAHHEAPAARIEPQRPVEQRVAPIEIASHKITPKTTIQTLKQHTAVTPGYFRRDAEYYGHVEVPFPYSDVDTSFIVPDGYETISVDGQTYYYNAGAFYQEVNGQLAAIPPVLGAVVDYIPQDYQIVMADGAHYLLTDGVYYQRVDQGFQVLQFPDSDQE